MEGIVSKFSSDFEDLLMFVLATAGSEDGGEFLLIFRRMWFGCQQIKLTQIAGGFYEYAFDDRTGFMPCSYLFSNHRQTCTSIFFSFERR